MLSASTKIGKLATADWKHLQQVAERLEKAWKSNDEMAETINLADFLPDDSNPLRFIILLELVKTDLEIRWRHGNKVVLEHYLSRFPELGTAETVSPDLIMEEFRVRQRYGDTPEMKTYRERFPQRYEALKARLQADPGPTPTKGSTPSNMLPSVNPIDATSSLVPVGGYRVIKRIGRGSFGEVWSGEAPGGVPVAIKIVLRPLDHEEAQREHQALELIKRLSHPFLLQTQAYWTLEDRLLIVMELADGSLRDGQRKYQQQGEPGFPVGELLRHFRESSEALDYLHSESVLHRDIKPDNILLHKKHAKIADFGLARLADTRRSVAGTGCGTPVYMAPEMWHNKVFRESDQYSLAMSYAELRLNRRIFNSPHMAGLMFMHLHEAPDLEGLPPREREVMLRVLSKDHVARYGSCLEWIDELEHAYRKDSGIASTVRLTDTASSLGDDAAAALTLTTPIHVRPPQRRLGRRLAMAGVLVVAVACATYFGLGWLESQRVAGMLESPLSEGRFSDAIELVQESGFLTLPFQGRLRERIRPAWNERARNLLDTRQFVNAEEMAKDILVQFPRDPTASDTLQLAWNETIPSLIAEGYYDQACRRLAGVELASADVQQQQLDNVRTLWRERADGELKKENFAVAEEDARVLLQRFPGDPEGKRIWQLAVLEVRRKEVLDLYDKKQFAKALQQVRAAKAELGDTFDELHRKIEKALLDWLQARINELLVASSFEEALAFVADEARDLGDRGESLRSSIRQAWFSAAKKAKDGSAKAQLCRNLLQYFPGDREASALLGTCSSDPEKQCDDLLIQAADKLNGNPQEALAIYRSIKLPSFRNKALLGEARALARLNDWPGVRDTLAKIGELTSRIELAHLDALRFLSEDLVADPKRLNDLADLRRRHAHLDPWEKSRLQQQEASYFERLCAAQQDRDRAFELANKILSIEPQCFPALLIRADFLIGEKRYEDLLKSFPAADAEKEPVRALRALVLASKKDAKSQSDAFDQIAQLLGGDNPPWRVTLCTALASLAEVNEPFHDKALEILERQRKQASEGAEQNHIDMLAKSLSGDSVESALSRAGREYDNREFEALKATLDKLTPKAAAYDPKQKQQFAALTALHELRDGSSAAERAQGFRRLPELLKDAEAPRIEQLCQAGSALARADAALMPEMLKLLAQVGQFRGSDGDKARSLRRGLLSHQLRSRIPDLNAKTKWEELLEDAEAAEPDALVQACRAECRIHQDKPDLRQARDEAKAALVLAPHDSYARFVLGLVLSASNKSPEAADEMLRALAAKPRLSTFRLECAQKVLQDAASASIADKPADGFSSPFASEQETQRTWKWLSAANDLAAETKQAMPVEARLRLALASWFKPEPDLAQAKKLSDELLALPNMKDHGYNVYLLFIRVRSLAAAADREPKVQALSLYAELARILHERLSPEQQFDLVIKPGLDLSEELEAEKYPEQKKLLASLQAAKGEVVGDNIYAKWEFRKEARQVAYTAWSEAARLAPKNIDYAVGKLYAACILPNPDWAALEKEANAAIKLEPEDSGVYSLLGHILLQRSRGERNREARLKLLKAAYKTCTDAATMKPSKREFERAKLFLHLSMICLELGNYDAGTERVPYLKKAREHALAATQAKHPYPDFAWEALGNALEDLAWLGGDKPLYQEAVDAFLTAAKKRGDRGMPYVAMARCRYRSVVCGGNPPEELKLALDNLDEVLTRKDQGKEAAEAWYWKAKILEASSQQRSEAAKAFESALKVSQDLKQQDWVEKTLEDWALFDLDSAKAQLFKKPTEARKLVETARARALQLETTQPDLALPVLRRALEMEGHLLVNAAMRTKPGAEREKLLNGAENCVAELTKRQATFPAALLQGACLQAAGELAEALKGYDAALPAELAEWKPVHVPLGLARLDLYGGPGEQLKRPLYANRLNQASRLIELAAGEDKTRAQGLAGIICAQAAYDEKEVKNKKDRDRYGEQAIDFLRLATKAGPSHPDDVWIFGFTLAVELSKAIAKSSEADKKPLRQEALKLVDDLRKLSIPALKADLDRLEKDLTGKK